MNPQHRTVPADAIVIDRRVQRDEGIDHRRVDRMAANFNPNALGVLILSQREDGTLVCLDGMHRHATCLKVGHAAWLDAIVHTGLSLADEAALFLAYNSKKDPSAISRFKARVVMGEPAAVEINRIVLSHGFRVGFDNYDGVLAAVEAVERIYTTGGGHLPKGAYPEILSRTLDIVVKAWGHDRDAVIGQIIHGLAQVLARFGDQVLDTRMAAKLQDEVPRPFLARARSLHSARGGTVPSSVAWLLVQTYNKDIRKNLLPEWVWTR